MRVGPAPRRPVLRQTPQPRQTGGPDTLEEGIKHPPGVLMHAPRLCSRQLPALGRVQPLTQVQQRRQYLGEFGITLGTLPQEPQMSLLQGRTRCAAKVAVKEPAAAVIRRQSFRRQASLFIGCHQYGPRPFVKGLSPNGGLDQVDGFIRLVQQGRRFGREDLQRHLLGCMACASLFRPVRGKFEARAAARREISRASSISGYASSGGSSPASRTSPRNRNRSRSTRVGSRT